MKRVWRTANRPPPTLQRRGQESEPRLRCRTLQIDPVCPHPDQMDLARTQSSSVSERVERKQMMREVEVVLLRDQASREKVTMALGTPCWVLRQSKPDGP